MKRLVWRQINKQIFQLQKKNEQLLIVLNTGWSSPRMFSLLLGLTVNDATRFHGACLFVLLNRIPLKIPKPQSNVNVRWPSVPAVFGALKLIFLIPVSDSLSSSVHPEFITRVKTVAQIAEDLEAGTTPGIIRNIRKKPAVSAVPCLTERLPLQLLLYCRIQWGTFSPDPLVSFPNMGWEGNRISPFILQISYGCRVRSICFWE